MNDDKDKNNGEIIPVSPETNDLVEQPMVGQDEPMVEQDEQIKTETKALVEAINKRAQLEISNAQTITQEAYLNAVRNAREALEQSELFDPQKIEDSVATIQQDMAENWQKTVTEITDFGDRLQEAATAAWEILTRKDDSSS
ncbi:MAG: hypothetical protein AAFQ80_03155 [Cyanobacteria bacterium J06621_8]